MSEINYGNLKKILDIQKKQVFAKVDNITIIISETEMKKFIDNVLTDEIIINNEKKILNVIDIPASFSIEYNNTNYEIFFPFNIKIPFNDDNVSYDNDFVLITFNKNDLIFYGDIKQNDTDITILDRLFDNNIKYISKDVSRLVLSIFNQILPTKTIMLHHIETLVSLLYLKEEDGNILPVRLTKNQKYDLTSARNIKNATHDIGNLSGYLMGYTKDFISKSISQPKMFSKKTKYEQIVSDEI